MLTSRGFWFLVPTLAILAAAVLLSALPLTLICLTLLLWFLGQWGYFQLMVRTGQRRLVISRSLRTVRGEVRSVWARQKVNLTVTLRSEGFLAFPFIAMIDHLPPLARLRDGTLRTDGAVARDKSLSIEYALECPAPGRLYFPGVRIEISDLQGFFFHASFIHEPVEIRVLPAFTHKKDQAALIKRYNQLPLVGAHRHARPGGATELLDLRDYLPGDPPRMIAWKVSARRDRLITREFESEVPIRCTLFLDISNSVRTGPLGETALGRLAEIAAGILQANAAKRDLTGLCLFDETGVQDTLKAGRGSKHVLRALGMLTEVADLLPISQHAHVSDLLPRAYLLVQDLYPEWLDRDVNAFPGWLPFWAPQPAWTTPRGAPRMSRWSPRSHRLYRWRKQLAAILAVRYGLGPGGLGQLLEDDERCSFFLQRFLVEHQVAFPFPLYDGRGRYQFAAPEKSGVLASEILKAVAHGKDNELFVLCIDLLESTEHLADLERAVRVAQGRHHQVIAICPWPAGVEPPAARPFATIGGFDVQQALKQIAVEKLHQSFHDIQRAFARAGVPVLCAAQADAVEQVLQRVRRLRIQERGVR